MIRWFVTAAIAPFLLASVARADDIPPRKAGLWEISMDTGRPTPRVVRYCIDAATDARMRDMGQSTVDGTCTRHDMRRSGDTMTGDSVCKMGSMEVTSHSVTTFTGDTAYTTVIKSHYEPPMPGGAADRTMTQTAKWIGPCGADMKPGDMMMEGRKIPMGGAPAGRP